MKNIVITLSFLVFSLIVSAQTNTIRSYNSIVKKPINIVFAPTPVYYITYTNNYTYNPPLYIRRFKIANYTINYKKYPILPTDPLFIYLKL